MSRTSGRVIRRVPDLQGDHRRVMDLPEGPATRPGPLGGSPNPSQTSLRVPNPSQTSLKVPRSIPDLQESTPTFRGPGWVPQLVPNLSEGCRPVPNLPEGTPIRLRPLGVSPDPSRTSGMVPQPVPDLPKDLPTCLRPSKRPPHSAQTSGRVPRPVPDRREDLQTRS